MSATGKTSINDYISMLVDPALIVGGIQVARSYMGGEGNTMLWGSEFVVSFGVLYAYDVFIDSNKDDPMELAMRAGTVVLALGALDYFGVIKSLSSFAPESIQGQWLGVALSIGASYLALTARTLLQ